MILLFLILSGLPSPSYAGKMVSCDPVLETERWTKDGPGPGVRYESHFSEIFQKLKIPYDSDYFFNFLAARKLKEQSTHTLDLMGSGYFLEFPLVADSITGLRLKPLDLSLSEVKRYGRRQAVLGDIFDPQTWVKLKQYMEANKIPKFDLIVMRPIGGWLYYEGFKSTEHQAESLINILDNAVSVISPTGQIYFSIEQADFKGSTQKHPLIQAFARKIRKQTPFYLSLISKMHLGLSLSTEGIIRPKALQK